MGGKAVAMKIGFFAEGCYPYVVGGVSSWTHQLIHHFANDTFALHTITATDQEFGRFAYQLPPNVVKVRECALEPSRPAGQRGGAKPTRAQWMALRQLVVGEETDWDQIFRLFDRPGISPGGLLMSLDFYQIALELYNKSYRQTVFIDFLWTLRSMYAPLFRVLAARVEEADLYHSVATGYAGVLAVKAARKYGRALIITEHGIYTREREEEIIKADWTHGVYKDMWIDFFYMLAHCCYRYSTRVISLFMGARGLQIEIGCPRDKTLVIPNGIHAELYTDLTHTQSDNIRVGSVLRIAPIKDVKTMLIAFSFAKEKVPNLELWLLGPTEEDPAYFEECREMAGALGVAQDVRFTGRVNVRDYLGNLDIFLLTSISEGQPIAMLEAMAAGIPVVSTRVGNCEGLVMGEKDDLGACGFIVPVMNASQVSDAVVTLARDKALRQQMGLVGKKRVFTHYTEEIFLQQYRELYAHLGKGG